MKICAIFFKLRCVRLYAWVLFGIQTYFCNGARTVQLTAAMTKGLTSSRFEFNHVCICQKISFSFWDFLLIFTRIYIYYVYIFCCVQNCYGKCHQITVCFWRGRRATPNKWSHSQQNLLWNSSERRFFFLFVKFSYRRRLHWLAKWK